MTQKERQDRSKEEICRAAMEEFGTLGYDKVTMERICGNHGISKGMMYHYYSNKDELFLLCVERTFTDLKAHVERDMGELEGQTFLDTAVIVVNDVGEKDRTITQAEIEKFRHKAEERERSGWENAIPFEGNRENIINLPLALSIGNISETGIGTEREKAISLLMGTFPSMAFQVVNELLNAAHKSYAMLVEQVQRGEPIRVWVSREPDAMCGLYWLMEQLRPIGLEKLDVTLVELPEWEKRPDGCIVRYTGWGEVEPYRFGEMALLGKKLPTNYLRSLANRWKELQQENATLRAALNGQLVSVPESLYDSFILSELEKQENEFKEAQLVGQVLGKYQLGIGDGWIALRIEQFIRDGLLIPITAPEPDAPIYHRTLQKAKK